jgi:hypothetical protein
MAWCEKLGESSGWNFVLCHATEDESLHEYVQHEVFDVYCHVIKHDSKAIMAVSVVEGHATGSG